jgi:hypothetical protein
MREKDYVEGLLTMNGAGTGSHLARNACQHRIRRFTVLGLNLGEIAKRQETVTDHRCIGQSGREAQKQ